MRCLTLAEQLRSAERDSLFVCRDLQGNLCAAIEQLGFALRRLPAPDTSMNNSMPLQDEYAQWLGVTWSTDAEETIQAMHSSGCSPELLIVDHYGLDHRWEEMMRPTAGKILVIDDLANRRHNCDFLLDQNLYDNIHERYRGLVPQSCRTLLGPSFALLRQEFETARKNMNPRDGTVRRILIFMGGADPSNETAKALEAIRIMNRADISVDVVVGETNPHQDSVRRMVEGMPSVTYHSQVNNIAELMAHADLSIGAGGISAWERCSLGLPSFILILAQNQEELANSVAKTGAAWNLGWAHSVSADMMARRMADVLGHPETIREVSQKAERLMHNASSSRAENLLTILLIDVMG